MGYRAQIRHSDEHRKTLNDGVACLATKMSDSALKLEPGTAISSADAPADQVGDGVDW